MSEGTAVAAAQPGAGMVNPDRGVAGVEQRACRTVLARLMLSRTILFGVGRLRGPQRGV